MTQNETAAAAPAETSSTEFKCSCGRTFAHEISLKRHRWVTGHAEAEPAPVAAAPAAAPAAAAAIETLAPALLTTAASDPISFDAGPAAPDAYAEAMETLLAKAREQREFERRQQLQAALDLLAEFGEWMLGLGRQATLQTLGVARLVGSKGLEGVALTARIMVLAAIVVGLLCGGISAGRALATGNSRPAAAPAPARASAAASRELVGATVAEPGPEQTVETFYSALAGSDCQAAYAQLSSEWKRALPFATFEQGYARTSALQCTLGEVTRTGTDRAVVEFTLQTVENGRVRHYAGSYVLVANARGWSLDSGNLQAL